MARTLDLNLVDSERGTAFIRPASHSLAPISVLGRLTRWLLVADGVRRDGGSLVG